MKANEAKFISDNKAISKGTYISYESVIERIKEILKKERVSYRCAFHGTLTTDVKERLEKDGYAIGYISESGLTLVSWL